LAAAAFARALGKCREIIIKSGESAVLSLLQANPYVAPKRLLFGFARSFAEAGFPVNCAVLGEFALTQYQRTRGRAISSSSSPSCPYSPKYLEGEFSELPLYGVLGSSLAGCSGLRTNLITFNTKITHLRDAQPVLRGVCCECYLSRDAVGSSASPFTPPFMEGRCLMGHRLIHKEGASSLPVGVGSSFLYQRKDRALKPRLLSPFQ
jgi:hypothetical protein